MKKRLIFSTLYYFFLFLLFSGTSYAESLKDRLALLLETNDLIQSYQEVKKASDHLLEQSRAGYRPTLDLSADGGSQDISKREANDWESSRSSGTLRATQLITDFGYTTNTIAKAKVFTERSEKELQAITQQVLFEGVSAYLNVVRAREKLIYAKKSEKNIKKQTGIEETLVKKGAGLSSDVLQAKGQLAGASALRVLAEGELEVAKNRYNAVFNRELSGKAISGFTSPSVNPGLIPASVEDATQRAIQNNPQIKMLKKDVIMSQKDIKISKASFYPTFNLFAEHESSENDAGVKGWKNDSKMGMELTWNILRGGGDQAACRAAWATLSASKKRLENTKRLIEEQVQNAWDNLNTQNENARILHDQSLIMGEFLELARKERKMGTRTLLDVLTGESTYILALVSAISAEIDKNIAGFNLLFAMGELGLEMF